MLILSYAQKEDVIRWGRTLFHGSKDRFDFFQETAQWLSEQIYQEIRQTNQERLFGLVRVFRLSQYHEILYELKTLVNPDEQYWMTLMGSCGDDPDWCDHRRSLDQRIVPVGTDPILTEAFAQIGLQPGIISDQNFAAVYEGTGLLPYFLIEQVSDRLLAPGDFDRAHGIKSVVGIGSAFLSGASYLLLGYSKQHLNENDAEKLAELFAFVTTPLASCDSQKRFWS